MVNNVSVNSTIVGFVVRDKNRPGMVKRGVTFQNGRLVKKLGARRFSACFGLRKENPETGAFAWLTAQALYPQAAKSAYI